jgi:hypothetical protein
MERTNSDGPHEFSRRKRLGRAVTLRPSEPVDVRAGSDWHDHSDVVHFRQHHFHSKQYDEHKRRSRDRDSHGRHFNTNHNSARLPARRL